MESKIILLITILILIVILSILIFKWKNEKCKSPTKNEEKINKKPKLSAKPTFERDGEFQVETRFRANATKNKQKLPKHFFAAKEWPNYITGIFDQERCGSCWSFVSAAALTDRIRIKTRGKHLSNGNYLSPFHLAACIKCGKENVCPRVCEGNYLDDVMQFLVDHGTASQSDIEKYYNKAESRDGRNPEEYACFDYAKAGVKPYKGKFKYRVNLYPPSMLNGNKSNLEENMHAMMEDIFNNGPVCCIIRVYSPPDSRNFYTYKSGVYGAGWKQEPAQTDGYHAINIMGWGEEVKDGKTIRFWIIRNSWGDDWGTSGLGKVLRGENFGLIESDVWGIMPLIE